MRKYTGFPGQSAEVRERHRFNMSDPAAQSILFRFLTQLGIEQEAIVFAFNTVVSRNAKKSGNRHLIRPIP